MMICSTQRSEKIVVFCQIVSQLNSLQQFDINFRLNKVFSCESFNIWVGVTHAHVAQLESVKYPCSLGRTYSLLYCHVWMFCTSVFQKELETKNLFSADNICVLHRRNGLVFFLQFCSIYSSDLKLIILQNVFVIMFVLKSADYCGNYDYKY